ncbi:hypothetical protein A5674_00170 [Mycobacterium malmoense]|uniref:Uncharacterized protein n=2 Tax=Mycobacterium malmoense TaxID=1780 RepID=A0A1B9D6C7_MYCMA|nr:hypothetical protein A5674_00170 [Mycobacterium malmoense]OCB50731.1 hypothetical protein A5677_23255 [Mycobacterium malmoense]
MITAGTVTASAAVGCRSLRAMILVSAAVAAYPFVFVPLLVLLGVALVASARYEEARNPSK